MNERADRFQRMFEAADLAHLPTIGGWTRKVQELEEHVAKGGKVNEGGSFFVQVSRGTDSTIDRVIDFFSCLPTTRKGSAMVIALYCSPRMLDEYPDVVRELATHGVHPRGESWSWTPRSGGAAGRFCSLFWSQLAKKKKNSSS